MKKITLWLFALFTCWQINAQTCNQTFSVTGQDNGPTVLTINAADVTCYGANPLISLKLENSAGSLTSGFCSSDGSSWFGFDLSIDGGPILTGCAADFNDIVLTGFTTLTITSHDDDVFSDTVTITIDVEATFTPLTPPLCVALSSPANGATNITSGSISWPVAAGGVAGYKLNVGTTTGGTDVLNLFDVGNVNTYNLGTLAPGITYYVTVVPYNVNGDAVGCTESSFTTCGAMMAPWTYDVEVAAATTNSTIADCWTSNPTVTNAAYRWDVDAAGSTPSFGTGPSAAFSGTKYFYTEASSGGTGAIAELYTPMVNISALTEPTLQFYYHMYGVNMGELHVDVFNGTSWVNDVDVIIGQQQAAETDPWLERIVDLSAYTGTIQVRFRAIRGAGFEGDMSLDDISFDEAPACLPVTGLMVSNITSSSVQINWNDMSGVNQFDFEYAVQVQGTGTPAGAGVAIDDITVVATNDITAIPLAPNSPYEVYVRADCGGGLFSSWVGPVNFTTECATYAAPLLETFDTFLPACWQEADNGDLVAGPATFGTAGWFADGFGNVGFTGAISYSIWLAQANDWVISPTINIPATGYELKFDAAVTQWSTTAPPTNPWEADDFVEVLVSTTGYTNWTVLYTYNNTNVPATTGTTNILDLDAYAGQDVRFAYRVVEGTANGATDLNFYVDNFEIRLTPSTPPVCATNVVATPNATCGNFANTITWDATVGADGYYLTIGTSTGASDVLSNSDLGNVLSYSFTGTIGTTYYYTLLPYNGVGPATGCTEMSFTTNVNGCYCTSTYTNGISDGDLISNIEIVGTTLSNNSGTDTAGASYTFFTGQPNYTASLQAGSTYNVTVTVGTIGGQNLAAWVDYNDNYVFEPSEKIGFTTTSIAANGTATFSITLACNPPLGDHRLRVRDVWNTNGNLIDPCVNYGYGETEDYIVTITSAVACPTPSALTATAITTSGATLGWTIGCSETVWDVHVDVAGAGAPTTNISNEAITTNPLVVSTLTDNTAYEFYVRANCGGTDGTSTWAGPFAFTTLSLPPANDNCATAQVLTPGGVFADNAVVGTNLGATDATEIAPTCGGYSGEEVWYSVTVPASGSITIECDTNTGTAITDTGLAVFSGACGALTQVGCSDDEGNGAFSMVSLTGRTPGEVLLVSVWEYGGGTFGTFKVSAYDASLSNDSFDNANFKAYPNPVKDILNLSYSTEISSVRIINLLGQEVVFANVNATSTQVDMSQLSAGAYIVNVTVGDTIKTIKVVKQ